MRRDLELGIEQVLDEHVYKDILEAAFPTDAAGGMAMRQLVDVACGGLALRQICARRDANAKQGVSEWRKVAGHGFDQTSEQASQASLRRSLTEGGQIRQLLKVIYAKAPETSSKDVPKILVQACSRVDWTGHHLSGFLANPWRSGA